jgi:glycosyltransferase involved in cell wall biosynthesis
MSDYVKRKFSLLSYKMNKVYYGIDERFYEKSNNKIDIEALRLVFPAQFRHGKNQGFLIKTFADYCKECNDNSSRLYLPGEGDFKHKNQLLATSLHVSDQVIFPGLLSLKSTRDLIETCNLLVNSSNSETFGKAIVEGYVLGKCILTKKVGIASDIIKEGINGYYFDNESELKNLLVQLSRNKSTIEEIGNNNFANREIFSWSHSRKDYSELLSNLIQS